MNAICTNNHLISIKYLPDTCSLCGSMLTRAIWDVQQNKYVKVRLSKRNRKLSRKDLTVIL
jgi:hypothetical protein